MTTTPPRDRTPEPPDPAPAPEPAPAPARPAAEDGRGTRRLPRGFVVGALVAALLTAFGTAFGTDVYDWVKGTALEPEEPFTATVNLQGENVTGYALPEPLHSGDQAYALRTGFATDREFSAFLRRNKGAPVSQARISLVLTGVRSSDVRITGMRVHRLGSGPALHGTAIRPYTQGEVASIPVSVDLDEQRPRVLGEGGAPYFEGYSIDIADEERVTMEIACTAERSHHRFLLAVDYVDDDGAHTRYLGDSGRTADSADQLSAGDAFRVTGPAERYGTVWEGSNAGHGYLPVP